MQVPQIVAVVFLYLAGFKLYFHWSRDKENNYIRGKRLFLKLDLVKGDQPNKQTKKTKRVAASLFFMRIGENRLPEFNQV